MKTSFSLQSALLVSALCLLLAPLVHAEFVMAGDKIPVLQTASGDKYESVTVREILPTGLKIMYDGGLKTIPAAQLPQYEEVFLKLQPEAAPAKPKAEPKPQPAAGSATIPADPAGKVEPGWLPANNDEVADCALFVDIPKATYHDGRTVSGHGSAFLCNVGNVTYIYSNAHNFDGAAEVKIHDQKGVEYKDFASIEIAGTNQAFWKETGWGGDVVRIKLKEFRPKALTLDTTPLTAENVKGRRVVITGNTLGQGKITQLEGAITKLVPDGIIEHNAPTQAGNSGSPIVDLSTHKVIGILTWGAKLSATLQDIWSKQPEEQREGIQMGAALATVRFEPTTFKILEQQRAAMNNLKKNIRLLGLLDTIVPEKQGVFVNTGRVVMGDYTVADLLAESPQHPVVQHLTALDNALRAKNHGSISINTMDMMKMYEGTYRACLGAITSERIAIETTQSATFYMKCLLKRSRSLEICKAYEGFCLKTANWFGAQQTAGGGGAVGNRVHIPVFTSGLKGLGLKDE